MKVELFSSIDKEDLLWVQSKCFEEFRIDELLDVASGGHLEMADQLLPLQTLDVQIDEIFVDIVKIDQMDDALLLKGVLGLLGKLLTLQEEDQLLRGHFDLLWDDPSDIFEVDLTGHCEEVCSLLAVSDVDVDLLRLDALRIDPA